MPPAKLDPDPPPIHRLLELIKSEPDATAALAHLELLVCHHRRAGGGRRTG
jgi:hypothetical protein